VARAKGLENASTFCKPNRSEDRILSGYAEGWAFSIFVKQKMELAVARKTSLRDAKSWFRWC